MSLEATRAAWQQRGLRPLHKLVLLALADMAGPDSTVWPSHDALMESTGADRKTIWQAIKVFREEGLVVDTGERRGRTGQIPVLRLLCIPKTKDVQKGNGSENGTVPFFPGKDSENGMVKHSENGIRNLSSESISKPERGTTRSSKGSRLPLDWRLPNDYREWSISNLGWSASQADVVAECFADYWHAATGKNATKADWFATWRNWCRREKAPASKPAASQPQAPMPGDLRTRFGAPEVFTLEMGWIPEAMA